jgi:threonine/homoserine/homoserine lactone efflux protein
MLASFESEPGGIPGGVAGTLVLATINTTFGLCSMAVWTYIGFHLQDRISNPKYSRVAVFVLGVLLLILSLLMLLRYHFA